MFMLIPWHSKFVHGCFSYKCQNEKNIRIKMLGTFDEIYDATLYVFSCCCSGVIGDPCDVLDDCTAAIYRSLCTNNTCRCIDDYDPIPARTRCVRRMFCTFCYYSFCLCKHIFMLQISFLEINLRE